MSNFRQLEVVGRGSETQLQVGENLNTIPQRIKGENIVISLHLKLDSCKIT